MIKFAVKLVCIAITVCSSAFSKHAHAEPPVTQATFNSDDSVNLPVRYREWSHVGTRYKPNHTLSILDNLPISTPEILNAYVEPKAMKAYQATGKWPEGSQIVKEFSSIKVDGDCDEKTGICATELGVGQFEAGYVGLGLMVKDSQRFPNAPGHWGFFHFGHKPPPYNRTARLLPDSQCAACHVRLASDSDFVITKAHIGLDRSHSGF